VSFSWIPFAAVLEGSMLTNLRSLASAAFVLGGSVWILRRLGWPTVIASLGVAGLSFALELTQMRLAGRTASITEPLLPLMAGLVLARILPVGPARHEG
jgi:hypothetical protein